MTSAALLINALLFNALLALYLITILQWQAYKLNRVFFHFSRPLWHAYFLALPCLLYLLLPLYSLAYFALIHAVVFYVWHKEMDKKLVLTTKVKFFLFCVLAASIFFAIFMIFLETSFSYLLNFLALPCSLILLKIYDFFSTFYFKNKAKKKLKKELKIILITASFGKTSMKNFLAELLAPGLRVHATPRSVNTLKGIIADINEKLPAECEIYLVEAGARERGDIAQITNFLRPQCCIIGEIGGAHLEYFKTLENTRATKREALLSPRLERAFLHSTASLPGDEDDEKIIIYERALRGVKSNLQGIDFELNLSEKAEEWTGLSAPLLGGFNAANIAAVALCAKYLKAELAPQKLSTKISKLSPIPHRLQIISREPKFIIDDGFNGNFAGMSASYLLAKNYPGRRVLITPGIIEAGQQSEELNERLARLINECFDLAIISASINAPIFERELKIERLILRRKSELIGALAQHTREGDLVLFSNDAPNFM